MLASPVMASPIALGAVIVMLESAAEAWGLFHWRHPPASPLAEHVAERMVGNMVWLVTESIAGRMGLTYIAASTG